MKKRMLCSLLTTALTASIVLTGCNEVREAPPELTPEAQAKLDAKQQEESEEQSTEEDPIDDIYEDDIIPEGEEGAVGGRGDYISACPTLEFTYEYPDVFDEDGTWLVEVYYPVIDVYCDFEDYTAAAESVMASCNGYEHWVTESVSEITDMIDSGDEVLSNLERSQDIPLTAANVNVAPSRVDSNVISLFENYYYFAGGAHPSYECGTTNIDVATGKELSLEDVIKDMEGFEAYALEKAENVANEYTENYDIQYFDDAKTAVSGILDQKWYFDASGIEFIYNPGDIAPYACGMLTFAMPYDELLSYMDGEYMPNTEDGFLAMPVGIDCQSTVINGMMVSITNEGGYDGKGCISAGSTTKTVVDKGYIQEAYLFKRLQKIYVFANYYQNERLCFSVYDVTDGDVREIYGVTDMGFVDTALSEDFVTLRSSADAQEQTEDMINIDEIIPME